MLSTPRQLTQHEPLDLGPSEAPSPLGIGLGMIALQASRHAFAICQVSGLDGDELVKAIDYADSVLSEITIETLLQTGVPVEPTASVFRLVVYGGPLHLHPPDGPGIAHIHVEDLASIRLDTQRSELGQDQQWF